MVGLKPIIGQTTSTVARTGMKLMGLRPQGQGSSFSPSRPLFFSHLPPAPCSTFPSPHLHRSSKLPACATRRIRNRILHHVRRPRAPRRRPNAPDLSWSSSRPPRPPPIPSLPYSPTLAGGFLRGCAGRRGRHHGGNQASRGGCSTDRMPRRSAVPCNSLVRLGQGI